MSSHTNHIEERTADYIRNHALLRESDVLSRLREETSGLEMAVMQISVEQGRLMSVLSGLLNVRRAIEIGVFTGYSALCVARHLPKDGRLVACDISEEWTNVGKPYWAEAGVDERIDLRLGPASKTLVELICEGESGSFDFAFIDADKTGYNDYYEKCLELLRPGGAILFDNIFWGGAALEPEDGDEDAKALHELTEKIYADERVDPALIPIGDGLLLVRKR